MTCTGAPMAEPSPAAPLGLSEALQRMLNRHAAATGLPPIELPHRTQPAPRVLGAELNPSAVLR